MTPGTARACGQRQRSNSAATGAPSISGTAQVGETLTAVTSGISDANGLTNVSYGYQWIRNDGTDDSNISGATGSTYTPVKADQGKTVKVRVSFRDDAGFSESLTSAATGEVAARPNSAATGAPKISGTAKTLTAGTTGISDDNGLSNARFAYQWLKVLGSVESEISGANQTGYTLTTAELAHRLKVKVSFTDDDGYSETLTSAATNPVNRPPNGIATGQPAVSGTVAVGETLTAVTSGISDVNGMTNPGFSYQWLHSVDGMDTDISGATNSTFVLSDDDVGNALKVKVSFTDDAGYSETVTSAATDTLLASEQQTVDDGRDPPSSRSTRLEKIHWDNLNGTRIESNGLGWAYPKYTFHQRFSHSVERVTIVPDPIHDSAVTYVITPADADSRDGHQLDVPAHGQTVLSIKITVTDTADSSRQSVYNGAIWRTAAPAAPEFTEGASAIRSVNEKTRGSANVGMPVTATDANGDTLTYGIKGGYNATFLVDSRTGQIRTRGALRYDVQSSYSLTLVVKDGTGREDEIDVTVNVIEVN